MKRTTFYITEKQVQRLNRLGKQLGIRVSELIRRLLDEALDAAEQKQMEKGETKK